MKWVKSKVRVNGRIYNGEIPMPKKHMQFSQKICVFGLILIAVTVAANFYLAWAEKPQMSDIVIQIVGVFGGFATGGYFALSGVRDCSKNKLKGKLAENEHEIDD